MMSAMSPDRALPDWVAALRGGVSDLDRAAPAGWVPPMDLLERPDGLEIRMDLAGVPAGAVRVTVRAGTLMIAGEKSPASCRAGATFHVAERACGRFARAIPIRMAFDASAVKATLRQGELRVVVPRIADRRGAVITVPIEAL